MKSFVNEKDLIRTQFSFHWNCLFFRWDKTFLFILHRRTTHTFGNGQIFDVSLQREFSKSIVTSHGTIFCKKLILKIRLNFLWFCIFCLHKNPIEWELRYKRMFFWKNRAKDFCIHFFFAKQKFSTSDSRKWKVLWMRRIWFELNFRFIGIVFFFVETKHFYSFSTEELLTRSEMAKFLMFRCNESFQNRL